MVTFPPDAGLSHTVTCPIFMCLLTHCSQGWLSHQLDEEEPPSLSTSWWQRASIPRATGWVELAVSSQPVSCTAILFRMDTKVGSCRLRRQVVPRENIQQHGWQAHGKKKPVALGKRGRGKEGSKVPGHISTDHLRVWTSPCFLPNPQGTSGEWCVPAMVHLSGRSCERAQDTCFIHTWTDLPAGR